MTKEELKFLVVIFRQIYLSILRCNEVEKEAYFAFFEKRMRYYLYTKRLLNRKMHRDGMRVSLWGTTTVHLEYIAMYEILSKFILFVREKSFPAFELRDEIFRFTADIYSYLESKVSFRDQKKYAYVEHYNQNDLNGQLFDTIDEVLDKLGCEHIIRDIHNTTQLIN